MPTDTVSVFGYVVDESTRTPLPTVQVYVEGSLQGGALTDRSGRYQLALPQTGNYRIVALLLDAHSDPFEVAVTAEPVRVDFTLDLDRAVPGCRLWVADNAYQYECR